MKYILTLFTGILFFLLCPGIFITIPDEKENKYIIAFVHSLFFMFIWFYSCKILYNFRIS
jgi:hypothetical protein